MSGNTLESHRKRSRRRKVEWVQDATLLVEPTSHIRDVQLPENWTNFGSKELSDALGI